MSTTTQFTTFEDLYLGLQKSVRVTTGISATTEQAKAYINTACHDFHIGYDYKFPWCERHSTLIVMAPYTTGTISVTAGSTSLTGSGTAWNTNNTYGVKNMRIGGKLTIAGGTDIYRISAAPGSDTSGTLGTRYVASSDASGAEYRYFEDEYALASDFLRPVDFRSFTSAFNIPVIDRNEWRRRYARPNIAGKPKVCCIIEDGFNGSTTPVRKIAFFPYPDAAYIFPYAYITNAIGVDSSGANLTSMSATTDEPIVPLRYRHVIHLKALARWYRDKRDDVRADSVLAEYVDLATRIVNDMDIGTTNKAQIRPSGGYWQAARKPYGMRTGRKIYDLNDDFDSFRR
jgi:hypothetical protein